MGHGGKRRGAGRPRGSVTLYSGAELLREVERELAADEAPLKTLAEIIAAALRSKDGRERTAALRMLVDKAVSGPATEVTGLGGGPVEFRFVEHRAGAVS